MKRKKIDIILIIEKLFEKDFSKYHRDYFDELKKFIRQNSEYCTTEEALLQLSCRYLYLSQKRFDFCQHFIRYCNNFIV